MGGTGASETLDTAYHKELGVCGNVLPENISVAVTVQCWSPWLHPSVLDSTMDIKTTGGEARVTQEALQGDDGVPCQAESLSSLHLCRRPQLMQAAGAAWLGAERELVLPPRRGQGRAEHWEPHERLLQMSWLWGISSFCFSLSKVENLLVCDRLSPKLDIPRNSLGLFGAQTTSLFSLKNVYPFLCN